MDFLSQIDDLFAGILSPALRALLWGTITAVVSMVIYARIAPQDKIRSLKAEQKSNKKLLKAYDGDFSGMRVLLKRDLGYSMKLVVISIVPFVVSLAPAVGLMYGLEAHYAEVAFPTIGADWTGSFEFWFLLAAIIVSLAIKIIFKIA